MNLILAPNVILQNRYQITQLLGQGGMGAVYQAWDLRLQGLIVAVKENFDNSPMAQMQFQTEAAILARLSHPALTRVTDYFIEPSGRQYLVMDFIAGQDLDQLVAQRGRLSESEAIGWITQVLDALVYLHSQTPPIIHRDIKPANIKLRSDGRAVLVDFGIAKVYDPTQRTQAGARAGTPGYAPLEQYGQGRTDARSDIYALGATLYFLLTAQVPPEATDVAAGLRSLTRPSAFGVVINPALEQTILRAMASEAGQRFQSAREFRNALTAPSRLQSMPSGTPSRPRALAPNAAAHPQLAAPPLSISIPVPRVPSRPWISVPLTPSVVYASWGRRAIAFIADIIVLMMLVFPGAIMAGVMDALAYGSSRGYSSSSGVFSTLFTCVMYILIPCYFVLCSTAWGQTLGKKMLGIKIVRINDGLPPGLGWSILRYIGMGTESFMFYCLIGFIGYLWPLWDQRKQALHDKLAGTIVIRV